MTFLGLMSAPRRFLAGLPSKYRVGLVTFSHRVWQRVRLTSDIELVRRVLKAADIAGGSMPASRAPVPRAKSLASWTWPEFEISVFTICGTRSHRNSCRTGPGEQ